MISIDKAAIIWSILIVFVAVGIAMFGNGQDLSHHNGKINPVTFNELNEQPSMISAIHLQTNKQVYNTNDVVMVSGYVDIIMGDIPITVVIVNPLENIVAISQVKVANDKTFVDYFEIGGPLWEQNGSYTIILHYGEKNTAETEFTFLSDLDPDAMLNQIDQTGWIDDDSFTIIEENIEFLVPYNITNAIISDVYLDCTSITLSLSLDTRDEGVLELQIPNDMISGIFMVLVDGVEWDDLSIIYDKITINFPDNIEDIEIIGTSNYRLDKYDRVCG